MNCSAKKTKIVFTIQPLWQGVKENKVTDSVKTSQLLHNSFTKSRHIMAMTQCYHIDANIKKII